MPADNDKTHERKLAAVLAADVAGYSKLMADDELATVAALKQARAVFRDRIAAHSGRLIDTAGDSVLAEFRSVVEAVDCAVEVQERLATDNAPVPEHRKMHFRIASTSAISSRKTTARSTATASTSRLASRAWRRPAG